MLPKKLYDLSKKNNHSQIIFTLLNVVNHQIPQYCENALQQAISAHKQILLDLRATMRLQKQQEAAEKDNKEDLESNPHKKIFRRLKSTIYYTQLARTKRFMLVYVSQRLNLIHKHFWAYGGCIMESQKANLAEYQKEYALKYQAVVKKFCRKSKINVLSCFQPPEKYFVQVYVNQSHPDILSEKGEAIKISRGSILFLPLCLVEGLILKNVLVETR